MLTLPIEADIPPFVAETFRFDMQNASLLGKYQALTASANRLFQAANEALPVPVAGMDNTTGADMFIEGAKLYQILTYLSVPGQHDFQDITGRYYARKVADELAQMDAVEALFAAQDNVIPMAQQAPVLTSAIYDMMERAGQYDATPIGYAVGGAALMRSVHIQSTRQYLNAV